MSLISTLPLKVTYFVLLLVNSHLLGCYLFVPNVKIERNVPILIFLGLSSIQVAIFAKFCQNRKNINVHEHW